MGQNNEEDEIKRLLGSLKHSAPPPELMKDFEAGVAKRVSQMKFRNALFLFFGIPAGMALLGVVAFAGWMFLRTPRGEVLTPAVEQNGIPRPSVEAMAGHSSEKIPTNMRTASEDKTLPDAEVDILLEDDLLILEMLGEDEGLINNSQLIQQNMETWLKAAGN